MALFVESDAGDQVDQLAQHHLVERRPCVVLGQHALEGLVIFFDGAHCVIDQRTNGRQLGVGLQVRPARILWHPEHVVGKVLVLVFGRLRIFGQQRLVPGLEGIGDVLQEDQPERDVLVVAWLHVAAQLVGGLEHIGLEAESSSVAVLVGVVLCHWASSYLRGAFAAGA